MMNMTARVNEFKDFKVIPHFPRYEINRYGTIRDTEKNSYVAQSVSNGYLVAYLIPEVDKDRPHAVKTSLKRVHRLVALTWLPPPTDPEKIEINHKDGNKQNNHVSNLEWVTKAENALHANKYLRYTTGVSLRCRTRNFETGEILEHASIQEAARYMGFKTTVNIAALTPKMFGKLVKDKFEVRVEGDDRPWFYENRTKKVCSRYMVVITYPDGNVKEFFNTGTLIKEFKLYRLVASGVYALADIIKELYPEYKIDIYDSYNLDLGIPNRLPNKRSDAQQTIAYNDDCVIIYRSASAAARDFKCDKATILRYVDTLQPYKGFLFIQEDFELIEMYKLRDAIEKRHPDRQLPAPLRDMDANSL